MRYGIVTETYPPEINGVALTAQGLDGETQREAYLLAEWRNPCRS